MRRLAWLAGLLLVTAACDEAPDAAPLPTYAADAEIDGTEAFFVRGTLGLHRGCLTVEAEDGEDGEDGTKVRAMLRLPAGGEARPTWSDDRLRFRQRSYRLGSDLVFRATSAEVADVDDVPAVCRDAGLEHVVSAVPEATVLTLDPSARVIGTGDQLRAPVAELTNGGMDAALRGELAVVGTRCLGVRGAGAGETLVVWPFGTTVSYDPDPVVTLPDHTTYAIGDRVELGGGGDDSPVAGLPPECEPLGRFLVAPF